MVVAGIGPACSHTSRNCPRSCGFFHGAALCGGRCRQERRWVAIAIQHPGTGRLPPRRLRHIKRSVAPARHAAPIV